MHSDPGIARAWLTAKPICVRCPAKATICDHDPPVRPHDRDGVLRGPIQSMCRPCNIHPGAARAILGQAA